MATSKLKVLRTCEFCGKEFYAQKVSTLYCSKRCNELAYKKRRRQKQVIETEARVTQKPIEAVNEKEILSLKDTAILLGITKRSVYNLIYKGTLRAHKLSNRMTFILKSDIVLMFEGKTYVKEVKPERKPITEYKAKSETCRQSYILAARLIQKKHL
ncbi:MAG: helix-turn-helix domain-containing protein [Bacteroidaceae bacterium]|nr:helix-turn-helix domain-containing protein [Bacteroidaceae bacterium]